MRTLTNTSTALFVAACITIAATLGGVAANYERQVHINRVDDYCLIMPSSRNTVGNSEDGGGGAKAFCTYPSEGQGSLPREQNAWKHGPTIQRGDGYVQITGCMRTSHFYTLVPDDGGGQYDSNGGNGGHGNPPYSSCAGYASYVEILEPSGGRACLRCCNNPNDCPLQFDTEGCGKIMPNGDYGDC